MRVGNTMPLMRFTTVDAVRKGLGKKDYHHEDEMGDPVLANGAAVAGSASVASGSRKGYICLLQRNGKQLIAYDDITGLELDGVKVVEARQQEIIRARKGCLEKDSKIGGH